MSDHVCGSTTGVAPGKSTAHCDMCGADTVNMVSEAPVEKVEQKPNPKPVKKQGVKAKAKAPAKKAAKKKKVKE